MARLSRKQQEAAPLQRGFAFRSFAKSAELFESCEAAMMREHKNKWIGIYDGHVAAIADTFQLLVSEIRQKKVPLNQTYIRCLESSPRTLIL
jgi:hypothetical protein